MGEAKASRQPTTVASLAEARAAMQRGIPGGDEILLESPTNAAITHGVLWFAELHRALALEFPETKFRLTLDCADRADLAHAALVEGLRSIKLRGHPKAIMAIRAIAAGLGAVLTAVPADADECDAGD